MPSYEMIEVKNKDNTIEIVINRPEVYNALNQQAKSELVHALDQANKSQETLSIILTANGKAFCSGQDLNDRNIQKQGQKNDLGHTLEAEWIPLIRAIRQNSKIVITALNGVSAGAGLSLALASDILVAKPKIKFISGFSAIGLVPDAGSTHALVHALGYHRALKFALLNEPLYTEDLHQVGLISYIDDDPVKKAYELASKINHLAPMAVSKLKENMQNGLDQNYNSMLALEVESQKKLGQSSDYQEGIKAFLEKRPAKFKGC